jgi:hypothetical protein
MSLLQNLITFSTLKSELEAFRLREREIADEIEEDAKELEKMASKQTVLQVIDE